jgi:hypothetical protein
VILAKTTHTELAHWVASDMPAGFSALGGQGALGGAEGDLEREIGVLPRYDPERAQDVELLARDDGERGDLRDGGVRLMRRTLIAVVLVALAVHGIGFALFATGGERPPDRGRGEVIATTRPR